MEISAYTAAQLVTLTESPRYQQLKHLPVSRLRALSHRHNPRLDADIPIMYIAWHHGEVVGYRMVLCDTMYVNNQPQPVGWYSCVWVDAEMRGQGIAKKLVNRCLQDWEGRIFGADAVPESRNLYLSTGLYKGDIYLNGSRAYLHSPLATLVIQKKPRLSPLKPLLALTDNLLNLLTPKGSPAMPAGIETINQVDEETEAFIKPYLQHLLFKRSKQDLNWITQYPWIRNGMPDDESQRYYFSSVAKRFAFVHWKLRDPQGRMMGYAMLSIRNGHLKTPYVFVEESAVKTLGQAIVAFMVTQKLEMVTTFHPGLVQYFKQHRKPFIFVKSVRREYFVSAPISQHIILGPNPNICDGDGDQAFT